jgi:hypothetical protein
MADDERDNVIPFAAPRDGGDDPVFEARLRRVLSVAVPSDLEARILLRQTTDARRAADAARRTRLAWRAAAMLVLGVATAGLFITATPPVQALPELAIDHTLHHEPGATARTARVSPSQVRALFARGGVILDAPPPEVHYINLCDLGRDLSVHFVSQQPGGPVTLYYVPGRIESMRMDFRQGGFSGRSVPLARGSLVMLAATDADFDRLERDWRLALDPRAGAHADR